MIRLWVLLCIIAGLGAMSAWLAGQPGSVTIYWFDWRIDTSFAFLIMVAAISAVLFAYLLIFLRALLLAPAHFSERRQMRHYHKGMAEITYSVAALAASDVKGAQQHTRKAEKLLGQTPLTLLLSAQVARNEGDEEKTRLLLTKMLDHKETEYLAARSLSESATKEHMFEKALPLAERARSVNPKETSSAASLVSLHIKLEKWQEALHSVQKASRKGAFNRQDKRHYRGIVYLAQGLKLLEAGQADAAVTNATLALKYLPKFTPAILFAARAMIAAGNLPKATKLILKHWKVSPHPELASALRIAIAKEAPAKQLKTIKKLAALLPDHAESNLAIAEVAIKLKEWDTAREVLKTVLEQHESMRACKLMAYTEQGEFADADAASRWLARSADAEPEAIWACNHCSHGSEHWQPHCPSCDKFDTLEWKQPTSLVFASEATS
ncbi:MAG: heme biosynthesis protein HemY [Rickettsiales bacterium]